MNLVLILHNIRSIYNVASIYRTADGAGVVKIYLVGVTPTPMDRFGKFRADFAKVALGAEKTVAWEYFKNFGAVYKKLKMSASGWTPDGGYEILAVEQDKRAIPYSFFIRSYEKRVDGGFALVFGEETRGLPKSVLDKCDKILEIPMRGAVVRQAHHPKNERNTSKLKGKESLNVSVAAGIVVFSLLYRV